ncbi:hypothetical protein LINPERHAP1_LOCUS13148 [Linum perenne]
MWWRTTLYPPSRMVYGLFKSLRTLRRSYVSRGRTRRLSGCSTNLLDTITFTIASIRCGSLWVAYRLLTWTKIASSLSSITN